MKKVDVFISNDQPGHVILTGGAIRDYFNPEKPMTTQERFEYFKGLMSVYPFMMMGNFHRWDNEGEAEVKDFYEFQQQVQPEISEEVVTVLTERFSEGSGIPEAAVADKMKDLLTKMPVRLLRKYHEWVSAGKPDAKDFSDFTASNQPSIDSILGGLLLSAYFNKEKPMSVADKTEIVLFFGTQLPYMLLKRYYTWIHGEDRTGLPGGPGGPGPGGPGGPGGPPPGGPPPMGGPGGPPPMGR